MRKHRFYESPGKRQDSLGSLYAAMVHSSIIVTLAFRRICVAPKLIYNKHAYTVVALPTNKTSKKLKLIHCILIDFALLLVLFYYYFSFSY